jgi:hypothetical protein
VAPLSNTASRVPELAKTEATALNHHYIGTKHILLGLMRKADSGGNTYAGTWPHLSGSRTLHPEVPPAG